MASAEGMMRAVMQGSPAVALEQFFTLPHPCARAQRWAGVALLWTRDFAGARLLLEAAAQRGERGAHLHLAYLHRTQGCLTFATSELERFSDNNSQGSQVRSIDHALDHCFEVQQRSLLLFCEDKLLQAAHVLGQGWGLTYECGFGETLRPGLALTHGLILFTLGEHGASLEWLDQVQGGTSAQQLYALGWRAAALAQLGRGLEAAQVLRQAEGLEIPAVAVAMNHYQRGITLQLLGQPETARRELEQARDISAAQGERETEALCLLSLLALTGPDSSEVASLERKRLLARASKLCVSGALHALYQFCALGTMYCSQPLKRAEHFERLWLELEGFERFRDAALVGLHTAEAWLAAGRELEGRMALERVSLSLCALGGLFLDVELTVLPLVMARVDTLGWRDSGLILGQLAPALPRLEIRVLGEGGVFFQGERLKLGYRSAAEFLYYIVKNPGVSASILALTLRPDAPARQTKVYLAGLGNALAKTGLLRLQNSTASGLSLECLGVELVVDACELERDLDQPACLDAALARYQPLLPGGEEWAGREAARLQRRVVNAAVASLSVALESGDGVRACALAEQALALDPFEPSLVGYLLDAIFEANGAGAAGRRARELGVEFALEGFELPPEVEHYLH